jgi:uncharacterized SAM-binding protein YcdF (DUF218 family)
VSEPVTGRGDDTADDTAMLPATFVLSDEAVPPHPAAPPGASYGGRRRSPWRWVIFGVLGVVALALLYYVVTLYQVWSTGRSDQARPVDAIVVMGAAQYDGTPSPQLAARLDQVVRLWDQDLAPLVVTTGGKQPGDRFTEAEASAAYLEDRGVPAEAIVLENDGSTTYESLEGVADILDARGLSSVLVVTDPYHALRARMVAEEVGLDAYVSPTTTSVVRGGASVRRHLQEAAGVALARPFGFDRLRGLAG